ncbi:conserved hypothetical protein [Echinococcus multilocularis]|uniref:Uncharacterized protein n=1 Tax=Echinococcus multilocularis TaxID=6211 RepID=A0A087W080_ECHMU|nr:conserved hypothetical protein [Echinococcus multilocularis]
MLSGLCSRIPLTTSESESNYNYSSSSSTSSTIPQLSVADSVPLVLPRPEKPPSQTHHGGVENLSLLAHLRRLVLGSSTFQFQRLQDADVEEDAHTVVTYISLGASTPLQQRHADSTPTVGNADGSQAVPLRQKSLKKRHVTWKDLKAEVSIEKGVPNRRSLYLPSLEEMKVEEKKVRRRYSYTGESGEEKNITFTSPVVVPLAPPPPPGYNEGVDLNEKKARYKLQLRHFKRRRRYSDWFFTLYEFDKPTNPEESLALDSHLFETILSRLHGIYALSLNSVFDPNSNQKPARLCFERLPKLPTVRRHQQRQHRRRRCDSRFANNSSSSCVSCISFGMFDSTSPHNPGQLFCPEREVGCGGPGRAFYCQGCGRNMTGGSSLASVAGSADSSQRPEICYSMTRSVEFYRFTRTIQWRKPHQNQPPEYRLRHRASLGQHHSTPQSTRQWVCRAPKRSRRRSNARRYPREAVSVPPSQPTAQPAQTQTQQPRRSSAKEKHKKVRRVMHKRMSQQRVADWLVATHGGQVDDCTAPLIVF